jgi:hypothetical protein
MNRNAKGAAGHALFFILKGAAGPGIGPAACRPGGEGDRVCKLELP